MFAEQRIGQRVHRPASILLWVGTWASGYFIIATDIATDAWMQHPVGYAISPGGSLGITDYWAVL